MVSRNRTAGFFASVAVGAVSALLLPSAASAQDSAQAIAVDRTVNGTLVESDPRLNDRHYDSYRLRLAKDESVQVDMASGDFDAYLDVMAPGGAEEPLKSHDDIGGGSRDARLRFTAPVAGDYLIRAQGYQGGTGAYTLGVKRRVVDPAPRVIAIAAGADVAGKFGERSAPDDDDHPYALYSFDGTEGERVRIDMVSAALDPALELTLEDAAGDRAFSTSNDDGGEALNARIFTILPRSGRYRIKARSINDQSGSYSLRVQKFPAAGPASPPQPLRREAPTLGRLDFADRDLQMAVNDAGEAAYFYRLYALPMRAGETLTIDLKAESFDPVLDAGIFSPLGFAVAKSNDDSDGTNARLVLTPTESGTIYLRARSLNAESMGEYTLIVTEGAAPDPERSEEEGDEHHH